MVTLPLVPARSRPATGPARDDGRRLAEQLIGAREEIHRIIGVLTAIARGLDEEGTGSGLVAPAEPRSRSSEAVGPRIASASYAAADLERITWRLARLADRLRASAAFAEGSPYRHT
jgi:hypothetical protein